MKAIDIRWQHVLKDKRKKKDNNTQKKEDERIKTNRMDRCWKFAKNENWGKTTDRKYALNF